MSIEGSWWKSYLSPYSANEWQFIRDAARARLEEAREKETIPLLADIYVSRLAATIEVGEATAAS